MNIVVLEMLKICQNEKALFHCQSDVLSSISIYFLLLHNHKEKWYTSTRSYRYITLESVGNFNLLGQYN